MVAPVLIGAGMQLLGGLLGGRSAKKAAAAQAEALRQTGTQAFESSRFRPVGITSRFGSSQFQVDPTTGALLGADYELSPELASIQDRLFSQLGQGDLSGQAIQQAQGLFGLGQQFIPTSADYTASPQATAYTDFLRQQAAMAAPAGFSSTPTEAAQAYTSRLGGLAEGVLPASFDTTASPEARALYSRLSGLSEQLTPQSLDTQAAAQRYVERQQALLRPERERQLAETREGLFRSGRGGLAVAQGGNLQATNPEMAAYYNALAQQDAQLAANAEQQARGNLAQDIGLASQLGTTALNQLTGSQQQALTNALARTQAGAGLLGTAFGASTQSGQQQLENALRLGTFAAGQAGTALTAQQQAEEIARQRLLSNIDVGTGLFGRGLDLASRGLAPLQSQLGLAESIEKLGQQPLTLGMGLGQTASDINARAAQLRLNPQTAATNAQASADRFNPWATALTAAGSAIGGMNFGSMFGGGAPTADTSIVGYTGPGRGNWF